MSPLTTSATQIERRVPLSFAARLRDRSLLGWSISRRRVVRLLTTLVFCVVGWATLAPPALGGSTSYVITEGVSMLPRFHAGDVEVVRKQSTYRIGEVVAYHNLELRTVVMHRIVALDGSRYVMKGDNNSYPDSYEPSAAQILGAGWVHLSGAGRWVLKLRQPVVAAALLGALWLFTFSPRTRSRRQRRRHRHAQ